MRTGGGKLEADTEYREERAQRGRVLRDALEDQYFFRSDGEKAEAKKPLKRRWDVCFFPRPCHESFQGDQQKKWSG